MLQSAFLLAVVSLAAAIVPAQQPPVETKAAVAPQYPPIAVAARVEGEVVVRVDIGPDGVVLKAEVVSGPAMLRQSAIQTVKKWRFTIGPETNRVSTVRFSYNLLSEDDPDEGQIVFFPPNAVVVRRRPAKPTVNY
jgi:TonB family protein